MKPINLSSEELLGTKSPVGVQRRGNRATRVPEILAVAIRVFAEGGSAGFSQRRVASEAGVRLSTVQHYFGTREDLLRSTIEALSTEALDHYHEIALDRRRSADDVIDNIVDDFFADLTDTHASMGAFAIHCWSLAEAEPFAHEMVAKHTGKLQEIFATMVGRLNPTLAAGECKLRAALIVSHLLGLLAYTRQAAADCPPMDALRVGTKAVWKALSKAPR